MKSKELGILHVKPFIPLTAKTQEEVQRKKDLRNFIINNISNLSEVKNSCKDAKTVSIEVCFNLYDGDKNDASRYCKDLDNLLKIVLDVLAEYMDNKSIDREFGLGIIRNDNQVSEIYSYKKFVQVLNLEGIDIAIFEWKD